MERFFSYEHMENNVNVKSWCNFWNSINVNRVRFPSDQRVTGARKFCVLIDVLVYQPLFYYLGWYGKLVFSLLNIFNERVRAIGTSRLENLSLINSNLIEIPWNIA